MSNRQESTRAASGLEFLAGSGELAELMRSMDWTGTVLGDPRSWPRSLKTAVQIMLTSRYAMWLGWGPELGFLYNDAYRPTLGIKHPWALGRTAREVWEEIWPDVGPRTERVLRTGAATWDVALRLFLERAGFSEETYHTFSYSPLPGEDGQVGGMLCVVTEETERIIGSRRLALLGGLGSDMTGITVEDEVWRLVARRFETEPHDLPFTLIYVIDEGTNTARLVCSSGLQVASDLAPETILLSSDLAPWPLRAILRDSGSVVVDDLAARFQSIPLGGWDRPPNRAVVVPISRQGGEVPAGCLVAGLNPHRPFDASYSGFLDLVAGQVALGLANARAHEQERRRAEALAEVDRAKTVFFSNVSHEFRTPLTLMLGPIEEALGFELDAPQRERLQVVHRNAMRLQKLVNTLLDFSKIEAGRMVASYEPTDLDRMTTDLASVFRSAIEKSGMEFLVDCRPLGEPVYIDHDMWEKVVLNLISNAFKFTLAGRIEVTLRREGDSAILRVADTGSGIAAEQLPYIFDRFHRVEGVRARTLEGTGIGLALVKELIGLHGGSVGVESEPGRGTTFRVSIPLGRGHLPADRIGVRQGSDSTALPPGTLHHLEEASRWADALGVRAGAGRAAEGLAESATNRPRILLADDNADMRDYVRGLLSRLYAVETVADGEAALASARARRPDLVLTDVMMPGLDGFGLLQALRADPSTRSVPVVMLSARAGEEATVEGLDAGVDDYLVKPFGARELLARVAALLEMARVRREASVQERALREEAELAHRRATTILESITDGFLATDRHWRFSYLNAAAERMTGLARGDLMGTLLWDAFPGLYESEFGTRYREALTRQVTVEYEGLFEPWGRWFEIRAYPSSDGGVSIYFRDLSDRKKAEAERERMLGRERLRSGQLQTLAEVSIRVAAARDVASIVGVVSTEASKLIQAREATIRLLDDPADDPSLGSLDRRVDSLVRRSNRPVRLDDPGRGPRVDPNLASENRLAAPLVGRDGKSLGLIRLSGKLQGDFTEDDEAILVQLAQMASVAVENARLYQELRDNDARKDEFLAMLAHELRNPLAAINNSVRLSAGSGTKEDLDWSTAVINRQLRHLSRLIDDLLDISRISRGKIDLRLGVVEVAPILESALETVRPLVEERGHRVELAIDRGGLWAQADPTRLEQVATNLLMNAAKYSEDHGQIWLSASRKGEEVIITVKDRGVGIDPEKLPEMFELFTQGDRSLARSEGGLGIGLTVVKKLVELHGGSVSATSKGVGQGSEFVVKFPSADGPVGGLPAVAKADRARRGPARILVVDDNVDTARGLGRLLQRSGHDVRIVHGGPEALEAASDFRPEIVLLDIGLPGMDGYHVAANLRTRDHGRDALIIALSGYGQEQDRRKSREAGFDHHLVKPVDLDVVLELLDQPNPAREAR